MNNRFDLTHNLENIVYNELLYMGYEVSYLDKDAFLYVAGDTFRGLAWEIEKGGWIKRLFFQI